MAWIWSCGACTEGGADERNCNRISVSPPSDNENRRWGRTGSSLALNEASATHNTTDHRPKHLRMRILGIAVQGAMSRVKVSVSERAQKRGPATTRCPEGTQHPWVLQRADETSARGGFVPTKHLAQDIRRSARYVANPSARRYGRRRLERVVYRRRCFENAAPGTDNTARLGLSVRISVMHTQMQREDAS